MKTLTFKTLIFENFWAPKVVGSSAYQKNIGLELTHWYMPSLCWMIIMNHSDHFLDLTWGYETRKRQPIVTLVLSLQPKSRGSPKFHKKRNWSRFSVRFNGYTIEVNNRIKFISILNCLSIALDSNISRKKLGRFFFLLPSSLQIWCPKCWIIR